LKPRGTAGSLPSGRGASFGPLPALSLAYGAGNPSTVM